MSKVREKRLNADFEKIRNYTTGNPSVKILLSKGDPPEHYQLSYNIKSLNMKNGEIGFIHNHLVEIYLPLSYPRMAPQCRMLTPVFHPNIAPHAICVGDHWSAGESLESIVVRIGEMLAYQSYNIKSPLNGEAARWVETNMDSLPIDKVSLLKKETVTSNSSDRNKSESSDSATSHSQSNSSHDDSSTQIETSRHQNVSTHKQTIVDEQKTIKCPQCLQKYKVPITFNKPQVKCKVCSSIFSTQTD